MTANGQDAPVNVQKGAKLYIHASNDYRPKVRKFNTSFFEQVSFITPGFALFWKQAQSYTEIGLSDWYAKTRKDELGNEEKLLNIGLRFEQGWKLGKQVKPLQVHLGYGVQPYMQHYKLEPEAATNFETTNIIVGVQIQFIPKLSYQFSNDWFIDFSLPIVFSDVGINKHVVKNPALSIQQQEQGGFDIDILRRNFIGRLGIGKTF